MNKIIFIGKNVIKFFLIVDKLLVKILISFFIVDKLWIVLF